jgi:hypothetical protein
MTFFNLLEGPGVIVSEIVSIGTKVCGTGAYEVTGMSPQSRTVAQLLKGFVSKGTL